MEGLVAVHRKRVAAARHGAERVTPKFESENFYLHNSTPKTFGSSLARALERLGGQSRKDHRGEILVDGVVLELGRLGLVRAAGARLREDAAFKVRPRLVLEAVLVVAKVLGDVLAGRHGTNEELARDNLGLAAREVARALVEDVELVRSAAPKGNALEEHIGLVLLSERTVLARLEEVRVDVALDKLAELAASCEMGLGLVNCAKDSTIRRKLADRLHQCAGHTLRMRIRRVRFAERHRNKCVPRH